MAERDIFRLAYQVSMLAEDSDTAEVMLYGEIIQDGPKWWKWSQEDKSAAEFDKALKEVKEKGARKLLLRINSPGGICTEAAAMRTMLIAAGFEEITIRIEGLCASAATYLATIPGAKVQIGDGSEYMIHRPWGGCLGTAEDMEKYAVRLRNTESTSRGFYTAKTGQSEEQVKAWMDAETWFTAEEAVKYGFADELLKAEGKDELPAAACVSGAAMATMKALYKAVPEQITVIEKEKADCHAGSAEPARNDKLAGEPADNPVTNGTPVAGAPSENKTNEEETQNMEPKELTAEEIKAQNPALFDQMRESAIQEERQRVEDIDALTLPGYEKMAAEAKKNGTSALEFQKQVVAAQKQRGSDYLQQRKAETQPSQDVKGAAAGDQQTEQQEIESFAKDVAAYAESYRGGDGGSMF